MQQEVGKKRRRKASIMLCFYPIQFFDLLMHRLGVLKSHDFFFVYKHLSDRSHLMAWILDVRSPLLETKLDQIWIEKLLSAVKCPPLKCMWVRVHMYRICICIYVCQIMLLLRLWYLKAFSSLSKSNLIKYEWRSSRVWPIQTPLSNVCMCTNVHMYVKSCSY